jgi:hypothetical protein
VGNNQGGLPLVGPQIGNGGLEVAQNLNLAQGTVVATTALVAGSRAAQGAVELTTAVLPRGRTFLSLLMSKY